MKHDAIDGPKTARLFRMVMPCHVCPYGLKSLSENVMMVAMALWMGRVFFA